MGTKGALSLIAVLVLVVSGAVASSTRALGRLPFQVLLNADGSGRIFMNDGSAPSWEACRPDRTACTPFATDSFSTGNAPPETVFWAGGDLITPVWKGNLGEIRPPSVEGKVRGNEVVTPVAALWAGGWESDYDELSFSVCKTATGEHCLQINYEGIEGDCGGNGATLLDPAFAGRYLRVVDRRYGSGAVFAGVGHPPYYPIPQIQPGATVAVAILGKIAPPAAPPRIDCGPSPLITASIAAEGSAKVECQLIGCRVTLIARRGRRTARVKRRLPPTPLSRRGRPTELRLTGASLERLGGGPIRVTVKVNSWAAARRTVDVGRRPLVANTKRKPVGNGPRS